MSAWRLGRKMAAQERRLRPALSDAIHFSRYDEFRLAHRSKLENSAVFASWEHRLQRLAEREGQRIGFRLDKTSKIWDEFYSYIFGPMKSAFWCGWEGARQLQPLYTQRRNKMLRQSMIPTTPGVLQASQMPIVLPDIPDEVSEEDRWDAIANKLFNDMEGDKNEDLWELPEARSIGAKGKTVPA